MEPTWQQQQKSQIKWKWKGALRDSFHRHHRKHFFNLSQSNFVTFKKKKANYASLYKLDM